MKNFNIKNKDNKIPQGRLAPFHPPWDKKANCPLPSTKRGLRYSQQGVTVASGEGALLRHVIKKAHHSQVPHLPLAPDKCANKLIPSLTYVEHNWYENKKVKRIKTQVN